MLLSAEMKQEYNAYYLEVKDYAKSADFDQTKAEEMMGKLQSLKSKIELQEQLEQAEKELGYSAIEESKFASEKPKWKNFGEQLNAIKNAAVSRGSNIDKRLITQVAGVNEGVNSEGGYLVDRDFVNDLNTSFYNNSMIFNKTRKIEIGANSNSIVINNAVQGYTDKNGEDVIFGGVQGFWVKEAAALTPSKPAFETQTIKLGKYAVLTYATEEMLQDVTALGSFISQAAGENFAHGIDNAIIRGDGTDNRPKGILNSSYTIKIKATKVDYITLANMYASIHSKDRAGAEWFISNDLIPDLLTLQDPAGHYIYIPAGVVAGQPFATLLGHPVNHPDAMSAKGQTGDIIFGNFSRYITITKGGVRADSSIHVEFLTDQMAFRFIRRIGGNTQFQAPIKGANGQLETSAFVTLDYSTGGGGTRSAPSGKGKNATQPIPDATKEVI